MPTPGCRPNVEGGTRLASRSPSPARPSAPCPEGSVRPAGLATAAGDQRREIVEVPGPTRPVDEETGWSRRVVCAPSPAGQAAGPGRPGGEPGRREEPPHRMRLGHRGPIPPAGHRRDRRNPYPPPSSGSALAILRMPNGAVGPLTHVRATPYTRRTFETSGGPRSPTAGSGGSAHVHLQLDVRRDGKDFFHRTWEETIERWPL